MAYFVYKTHVTSSLMNRQNSYVAFKMAKNISVSRSLIDYLWLNKSYPLIFRQYSDDLPARGIATRLNYEVGNLINVHTASSVLSHQV